MKRLLAICLAVLLMVSCLPAQHAFAATYQTATVKGGWLRLRAAASFNGQVLGNYFTGTEVTVLGTSGAWYHVRTQSGQEGYMYGAYLTVTTSGSTNNQTAGTAAYVVSQNGKGVRLRSGPGTAYGVLGLYDIGTRATILTYGTDWHYIRIGNQTGYMMAAYLSTGSAPTAKPTDTPSYGTGYTAYVTSQNGKAVRLRAGRGTEYDVIASYEVGTKVTVLEYAYDWCYISVGANTGYMMTEFLTTKAVGNTVTDVVLSTYTPTVGTRITATVYPAGATVSYQWMDDNGTLLSYASSYTVTSAQQGRRIYLQVTGYGSSTGSVKSSYTAAVAGSNVPNNITSAYQLKGITVSSTKPRVGDTIYASVTPEGASASYAWYSDNGLLLGTGNNYTVQSVAVGHSVYCVAIGTGNTSGTVTSQFTDQVENKAATYTVQSVQLNNLMPVVGDVVTATVKPDGASVTYAWYREDGRQLALNRSYTVQTQDAGYKLYCVAVGSGDTTGAATSAYTAAVTNPSQALSGTVSIANGATVGSELKPTLSLNSSNVTYQWYQNGVLIGTGATLILTESMVGDDVRLVVQAIPGSGYTGEVGSNYCYVQRAFQGIQEI